MPKPPRIKVRLPARAAVPLYAVKVVKHDAVRKARFVRSKILGNSDRQAAMDSGVIPGQAGRGAKEMLDMPDVQRQLQLALNRQGAGIHDAAKVIGEGMRATKTTYFAFQGEVKDKRTDPDTRLRLDSALEALRLHGVDTRKAELESGTRLTVNFVAIKNIMLENRKKRGLPPL